MLLPCCDSFADRIITKKNYIRERLCVVCIGYICESLYLSVSDSHAERYFRGIISSGSHNLPKAPKSKIENLPVILNGEGLNVLFLFLLAALASVRALIGRSWVTVKCLLLAVAHRII